MTYIDPDTGKAYSHPPSVEKAIELRDHLYVDINTRCDVCDASGKIYEHPIRYVSNNECLKCIVEGDNGYEAQRLNTNWDKYTLKPHGCKGGPHIIKYLKGTKRCATCEEIPSPRQQALAAGETWYLPKHHCTKCGCRALKRVYDGVCQGCMNAESPMSMEEAEALVPHGTEIDRETALSLGLLVYRDTGNTLRDTRTGRRLIDCV